MNIGKESEYVEFKESTAEIDRALEAIAAMLNKNGRGTLYFGVKNNGDVVGQVVGDSTLNQLSQSIAGNIRPLCYYTVSEKKLPDGKSMIEVQFSGNRSPYSAKGRYFLRNHDENRQMDNDMLRHYYLSQRSDYSEWEKADSGRPVTDIDEQQLQAYVVRGNEKGRLALEYSTREKVLGKLGLLYSEINLNNAGNVLFSREKPVRLKLVKFASDTRLTILDLQLFEGNVFECIQKEMDYLSSNINWNLKMTGDVRRTEEPEIPLEAAREIIVNAFSHGDYNANTDFEMAIYSDRVSIYSPGAFPKPYTPEDFAEKGLEPIPLNVTISDILFRDGTIEQISTGFERTFEVCSRQKVDYDYTETPDGFRFTFYRKVTTQTKAQASGEKVESFIREHPTASVVEVADALKISTRTVQRYLKKLKEAGRLIQQEAEGVKVWVLTD